MNKSWHFNASRSILRSLAISCPTCAASGSQRLALALHWSLSSKLAHRRLSSRSSASSGRIPQNGAPEPSTEIPERSIWRDRQIDDVVAGDLAATLEAHRKSNKRNIFKPIILGEYAVQTKPLKRRDEAKNATGAPSSTGAAGMESIRPPGGAKVTRANKAIERLIHKRSSKNTSSEMPRRASRGGAYVQLQSYPGEEEFRPWETAESIGMLDRRARLNVELETLAGWISTTQEEADFRSLLATYLSTFLASKPSNIDEIQVFGSQKSSLAFPMSDIDIRFDVEDIRRAEGRGPSLGLGRPENLRLVKDALSKLTAWVKELGTFGRVSDVSHAGYPLIKFQHKGSHLEVQVVYHKDRVPDEDHIQSYIDDYPQLSSIYSIVKSALDVRGLGNRAHGGIGSYPLLIMIVTSFKITGITRRDDLVDALLAFLTFYVNLDTRSNGVSAILPKLFRKRDPRNHLSSLEKVRIHESPIMDGISRINAIQESFPDALCLQHPMHPRVDITRSCVRYPDIKQTICGLEEATRAWLDTQPHPARKHGSESVLSEYFGTSLGAIRHQRLQFAEFMASDNGQSQMRHMREFLESHTRRRPRADATGHKGDGMKL